LVNSGPACHNNHVGIPRRDGKRHSLNTAGASGEKSQQMEAEDDGMHLAVRGRAENWVLAIKVDKINRLRENEGQRFYDDWRETAANKNMRIIHACKGENIWLSFAVRSNRKHIERRG
jgi:hypothetical protein